MATRKQFLKSAVSAVAGLAATTVDARLNGALKHVDLRPPGAAETGFHDVCTSCGNCAAACPETAIVMRPNTLSDKLLPVMVPSVRACAMCDRVPCISACQEGALGPAPNGRFPSIGTAVVAAGSCLAFNGSVCMTCFDACPLKRTALKLQHNRPAVDPESCTGCGLCEYACPMDEKGIAVEPR